MLNAHLTLANDSHESREEANSRESIAKLNAATGVYFTGGDQFRITLLLDGTKIDLYLLDRFDGSDDLCKNTDT